VVGVLHETLLLLHNMPKIFTSKSQKTGQIGENIACTFLVKHGFSIIERNYTKKWGEIDIVAEKLGKLYFIEVKSVTQKFGSMCNNLSNHEKRLRTSIANGSESERHTPEENMHPFKIKRMARTLQTYLLEKDISEDMDWQVDLFVIYMDFEKRMAKVKVVKDIIL